MTPRVPTLPLVLALFAALLAGPAVPRAGCLDCHQGIEPIVPEGHPMAEALRAAAPEGDPAACTVCHRGNPATRIGWKAHAGLVRDPGDPRVNEETCGRCHEEQVRVQWQSLMMTEAGKIQGVAWAAGGLTGYQHRWANYDVRALPPEERRGTEAYRDYRRRLEEAEPQVYPGEMVQVPRAPEDAGDLAAVAEHPETAAYTYVRTECLRCHPAVRGRQTRGDYRGMGCSACHVPYGNEGLYEGGDPTISRKRPGRLLVHRLQGTAGLAVEANGKRWSGIPVETCTTCHDRGKRIGVSYQGLMESPYASPWAEDGGEQPALHTKHYVAMQMDLHYQRGMLCQDCHTTIDVHGDGGLAGSGLAMVEIECADCHGTPGAFPWELPLGFGDEIAGTDGEPRGVAEGGALLTARGNPFENVTRDGDTVVVRGASGKTWRLVPLKARELPVDARVAMRQVGVHVQRMECYACHSAWVPQCYGCHVKVDYSGGDTANDWVATGAADGVTPRPVPAHVVESRSYLRWEDPVLGVNGEGRVTPLAPGCQVSWTVIGRDGRVVLRNRVFRSPGGTEGAGPEGQLTLDMSPTTPHTVGPARSCESCHASGKAIGYGDPAQRPWDEDTVVDLETADHEPIPASARVQVPAVPGVSDWMAIVDENGQQLMTVGHHLTRSGPLSDRQRAILDRRGVCLACHREIPAESLAVSLLHHVADVTGQLPVTAAEHGSLLRRILLWVGWVQAAGAVLVPLLVLFLFWRWRAGRRDRRRW